MKQHPYQYKILVEYLNPVEKGRTAHLPPIVFSPGD